MHSMYGTIYTNVCYQNDNIIIEKGRGSYLYDTEGNKYLDGYASHGSMCMGISIKVK